MKLMSLLRCGHVRPRLFQLLYSICEQRNTLADVIVKLSRYPRALSFLGLDQPAAQFKWDLREFLLLGDVETATREAREASTFMKPWHSLKYKPPVPAVMTLEPDDRIEWLSLFKRLGIDTLKFGGV